MSVGGITTDDDVADIAECISVAADGSVLIVDQFGRVEQALEDAQTWTEVTPAGWSSIAISADLMCASQAKSGDIGLKALALTWSPWQVPPSSGALIAQVSLTVDSTGQEMVWAVDAQRQVWTYGVESQQWTPQTRILADMIAATSDGSVFRLDSGVLSALDDTAGWVTISTPEAPVSIAAGAEGWLWFIGAKQIYQYDGVEGWVSIEPPVVDPAAQLGCGDDATTWLVAGGSLYSFDATTMGWTVMPGPEESGHPLTLTAVAVGNSSAAAVIDSRGVIWRYSGRDQEFTPLPNVRIGPGAVVAAVNRDQFFAIDTETGQVVAGSSTGGINGPWTITPMAQQPGQPLVWISATSQGEAWGVDARGGAWELPVAGEGWQSRSQTPNLTRVSVAGRGVVAGIDTTGAAYVWVANSAAWSPVPGEVEALVSLATTPQGALWAVDANGLTYLWLGEWLPTASQGLKAIAVGGKSNIWGIVSATGAPIQLGSENDIAEAGVTQADVGDSLSKLPAWETANPFDEAQSTHLWIVNRAAQLAQLQGTIGADIWAMVKPFAPKIGDPFHDNLCQGLYDADYKSPYNNKKLGLATWASHFFDPDTGRNWLNKTSPTALTEGRAHFRNALSAHQQSDMGKAGYELGLSLHYLTDVTQPMHAKNFTYQSSAPKFGLHSDFETYIMEIQNRVDPPTVYVPSTLGTRPDGYIITAARYTKDTFAQQITDGSDSYVGWLDFVQGEVARRYVRPMLTFAITVTSQYLVAWMQAALGETDTPETTSWDDAGLV